MESADVVETLEEMAQLGAGAAQLSAAFEHVAIIGHIYSGKRYGRQFHSSPHAP
jgi:hypothetical protein